jgi:ferric-dicitrate binding protein FerR (iron transport regulator)
MTLDRFKRIKLAEKLIADMKKREFAEAERILAEVGTIPGLTMSNPRRVPVIKSAPTVWQRIGKDIGAEAFAEACSLSLNDLVKPFQQSQGIKTQTEAKRELQLILDDVIEVRESKPYLVEG